MSATDEHALGAEYDVISLGEVMLRLAPPRFQRLRRAASLDIEVAGAQLNVAADLARLGKRSAFVSKLPDNALGELARDACASYGVDMRYVARVEGARMGLNFLEFTVTPRAPVTIFDRGGSAASTMTAADFDWGEVLSGARVAHTDGIFPGLNAGCQGATRAYLEAARHQGCTTTFDMNYRQHVWPPDDARRALEQLLPLVDVVVTSPNVSKALFGFTGDDEQVARGYADAFGCATVVVTRREMHGVERGAWSSLALHRGDALHGRRIAFEVVDRYGTGDAFVAGLVYGILERDVQFGLDFGNAACALAHTIEGDVAQASADEVMAVLDGDGDLGPRR